MWPKMHAMGSAGIRLRGVMVARRIPNPKVVGSIPTGVSPFEKDIEINIEINRAATQQKGEEEDDARLDQGRTTSK